MIDGVEGVTYALQDVRSTLPSRFLLGKQALAFLSLLARGYVLCHLREAAQVSRLVPQSRDEHVRPESGAVLAYPYSFFLVAALRGRDAQLFVRVPAFDVLIGVEDREVLSDDLLGLIALDALGAWIPGGDVPFGVEHEDGVVLDALHQEPEALLALPENLLYGPWRFSEIGRLHRHYSTTSETRVRYGCIKEGWREASRLCYGLVLFGRHVPLSP